ncbi:MAG: flagellar biosynthesis protein FlhF [Phycisphaerae bacterium]
MPEHFQGQTIDQAIARAKSCLGPDAVILRKRPIPVGGLLGWLTNRKQWQVVADRPEEIFDADGPGEYLGSQAERTTESARPDAAGRPAELQREIRQIRDLLGRLSQDQRPETVEPAEPMARMRARLLSQGIQGDLVARIVQQAGQMLPVDLRIQPDAVLEAFSQATASQIAAGPGQIPPGSVIAVVGPTGVGKTTTIAKLAAWCKLRQKRSVGLITMDTYRIAAVDQLRTYAEIIDLPLETVMSPGEMARAVHDMRSLDVVLIDTAGRSQRARQQLERLRSFCTAAGDPEIVLAVSATASAECIDQTARAYGQIGARSVILTKLDEAVTLGSAVNLSQTCDMKIRYVTTGQDVPQNIEPAEAARLAGWILQGPPGGSIE